MTSQDLIKIAVIADAHGIKGEVKLRCFSEIPDFLTANPILLDASGNKKYTIKTTGRVKEYTIASISGITDRNAAESLKNTELYIPLSALPPAADGEFYHNELISLKARLESGEEFGTVTAIHNFGAGDIMEITKLSGATEMLPLNEPWVSEINIKQGYVTVTPAEYL